ncbi:helix-turn-helix domain-containing protein [Williamsia deligens]|uniref:Helix-turn-helix domain-containing protein n=1 Tax=Williamsia deligens TaxID=321325 RepID=A0ABW3G945_9NOCA|nr:helix-turn-helix transcriptional regulator [Williamsia deligens]MCP2195965.1 Transcriptional regulator, contains XRE-family HTH domain [Williamsia deligens]
MSTRVPVGEQLRGWRERRGLSQLAVSAETGVSTRHLSWVETGRSRPSAAMVLRLADHLDVPLRDRNGLLLAAGHAPVHSEHALDDPEVAAVAEAMTTILDAHRPYPALVLDRRWRVVAANDAVAPLLVGCAEELLAPPIDVLRLTLDAGGLAPRIVDLPTWRAHLLGRVRRRHRATGDADLRAVLAEFDRFPDEAPAPTDPVVLLRLRVGDAVVSLFSMSAAVQTAGDITVEELAVELFFPADDETRAWFTAR